MTTDEMKVNIEQQRKRAFLRAKLSIVCLETNTDKNKCYNCKSFRVCREILETV